MFITGKNETGESMNTNWYKDKIEELGAIKTCINEIEAKYAPERADLNAKKSTMQKAYNKELEPFSKDKKAVEEEVEGFSEAPSA